MNINEESGHLYKELLKEHNRVLNFLPKASRDKASRTVFLARKFLFDSGILCGQVLWALNEKKVFLAVIGTKTLIETEINTKYIFLHPHSKSESQWVQEKCDIYIDKYGIDDDRLNGKSLADRARAIKLDQRYATYKDLCKIAHGTQFTSLVTVRNNGLEMFSKSTYIEALISANNTRSYIETWRDIETDLTLERGLIQFRDKYLPITNRG